MPIIEEVGDLTPIGPSTENNHVMEDNKLVTINSTMESTHNFLNSIQPYFSNPTQTALLDLYKNERESMTEKERERLFCLLENAIPKHQIDFEPLVSSMVKLVDASRRNIELRTELLKKTEIGVASIRNSTVNLMDEMKKQNEKDEKNKIIQLIKETVSEVPRTQKRKYRRSIETTDDDNEPKKKKLGRRPNTVLPASSNNISTRGIFIK